MPGNPIFKVLISIVITFAAGVLSFITAYNIVLIIDPPYVSDGETVHPVMPIGAALVGTLFAIVGSIISLYICYKRFKPWKK